MKNFGKPGEHWLSAWCNGIPHETQPPTQPTRVRSCFFKIIIMLAQTHQTLPGRVRKGLVILVKRARGHSIERASFGTQIGNVSPRPAWVACMHGSVVEPEVRVHRRWLLMCSWRAVDNSSTAPCTPCWSRPFGTLYFLYFDNTTCSVAGQHAEPTPNATNRRYRLAS